MKRTIFCFWFAVVFVTTSASISVAIRAERFDNREKTYVAGLRSRQLYRVAEFYCTESLKRTDLTITDQAALTVELIQNRAAAAQVASAGERDAAWQSVWQTQSNFESAFPRHPKLLLVTIQTALSRLSYAASIQQELSAEMIPLKKVESRRDTMIDQLRVARRTFEDVERKIERMIPEQRAKSPGEDEFSIEQLAIMRSNVRFQLARCNLQTAYGYEASDTVNRASIIGDVLQRLNEVQNSVSSQQRIWWLAKITQVECQRLIGRNADAWQTLNRLPEEDRPADLASDILEQRLLVAVARGDIKWAKKHLNDAETKRLTNQSPQMDIAQMKAAIMLSSNANSSADRQRWLDRAADIVRSTDARHGAYWSRRAGLALIEATGGNSSSAAAMASGTSQSTETAGTNSSAGQREILIQTARRAARSGNSEDAIKAWIRAIEITPQAADRQPLLINLSKQLEGLKRHQEAAKYLLIGAVDYSKAPNAAAMHLRGCWNLAQARETGKDELIDALQEHLRQWPQSGTRVQATTWLATEYNNRKAFQSTIDLLTRIPVSKKTIAQLRNTYYLAQKHFAKDAKNPTGASQLAARIVGYLQQQWPTTKDASTAESIVEVAAEIALLSECLADGEVAAMITRHGARFQIADQSPIQLYRSWLTVELNSDVPAAVEILNRASPSELACRRLLAISKDRKDLGSDLKIAQFQLAVVEQALRHPLSATQKTAWVFEQAKLLRATGQVEKSLAILSPLAKEMKKDISIQLQYARALSESAAEAGRADDALQTWRTLAQRLQPATDPWYEAKFNVAKTLMETGQGDAGIKLLKYVDALHGWEETKWSEQVKQLLK